MLAGVPSAVVTRAKQILASLEAGAVKTAKPKKEEDNITFEDIAEESIKDKLRSIDLNTITPLEALSLLFELKKLAE